MHLFSVNKFLTPLHDSEEQLHHHILWVLFIRIILFTLLLGITTFLKSKGHDAILPSIKITLPFILIIYIYTISSAFILQLTAPRLRRFGVWQLLSDTGFTAILVYGTGCSQSIFTPIFILPIVAGGLIWYRSGGLILATAASFSYAVVLALEYYHYFPPYFAFTHYKILHFPLANLNVFAVYGLLFFLTAILSGMLAGRLRTTENALTATSLQLDRLSLLYKQIFNDINTGIITIDGDDNISSFNPAAERISGYPAAELLGHRFAHTFPQITSAAAGKSVADLQRQDGTMTRVGYSFSQLNLPEQLAPDSSPQECCQIITLQDISKIEKMEKQIVEAENMAAIGKLSASIAHDFRNPLAAISGCAQILALEFKGGSETNKDTQHRLTEIILRESGRMTKTIADFLQFARPAPIKPEWFDIRRLAEQIIAQGFDSRGHHPDCDIIIDIEENLDIWGGQQQLQAALKHLLDNSCQATTNTAEPVILCAREDSWRGKPIILIEIIDKGKGIAPDIQEKIFEPFYSTREDGTGLGLAIVKHIVELHNGTLQLYSIEGQGCTVQLRLPLPESPIR